MVDGHCIEAQPVATGVTGNLAWSQVTVCGLRSHQSDAHPAVRSRSGARILPRPAIASECALLPLQTPRRHRLRALQRRSRGCYGKHAVKVVPTVSFSDQHDCDVLACMCALHAGGHVPSTVQVDSGLNQSARPRTKAFPLSAASNKQACACCVMTQTLNT